MLVIRLAACTHLQPFLRYTGISQVFFISIGCGSRMHKWGGDWGYTCIMTEKQLERKLLIDDIPGHAVALSSLHRFTSTLSCSREFSSDCTVAQLFLCHMQVPPVPTPPHVCILDPHPTEMKNACDISVGGTQPAATSMSTRTDSLKPDSGFKKY